MAINLLDINLGAYANDSTGDDLRTAFTKVKSNLNTLKTSLENTPVSEIASAGGISLVVSTTAKDIGQLVTLKGLSAGNNITITESQGVLRISAATQVFNLSDDINPELAGDLNINNFKIIGSGEIDTTGNVNANAISAINLFASGVGAFSNIQVASGSLNSVAIGDSVPGTGKFTSIASQTLTTESLEVTGSDYTSIPFVQSSGIRLSQLTTVQRDALVPADGDLIFNATEKKFQGFANGEWVNLH